MKPGGGSLETVPETVRPLPCWHPLDPTPTDWVHMALLSSALFQYTPYCFYCKKADRVAFMLSVVLGLQWWAMEAFTLKRSRPISGLGLLRRGAYKELWVDIALASAEKSPSTPRIDTQSF